MLEPRVVKTATIHPIKAILCSVLTLVVAQLGIAQHTTISSKQLTKIEVDSIFTTSVRDSLKIEYDLYKIYEYNDKVGKHFLVMTENQWECGELSKCYNTLKGYCFLYENGAFVREWSLTDFILPDENDESYEYTISFWTKYFELDDYDGDGIVDPILVYGTLGSNEFDDGRIKILVYHNGKKRTIRHQNSTSDFGRHTQVDKMYYELPVAIQSRVKNIMENITENDHGIFPYGWQKAMENGALKFDETEDASPPVVQSITQPDVSDKKFVATVGWLCEEILDDEDGCASEEEHLVLRFKKEQLTTSLDEIDSCGETVNVKPLGTFQYKWEKNKNWFVMLNAQEIEETILENLTLTYVEGTLMGLKSKNDKITEYRFREIKD